MLIRYVIFLLSTIAFHIEYTNGHYKQPTIFIVLLLRNKEHTLPYFLTYFENLSYPKNRISLYIRSDHNQDLTPDILTTWLHTHKYNFNLVDFAVDYSSSKYIDERSLSEWSDGRFATIIRLKEESLKLARKYWADYIWFLDADVFLTDPDIIQKMIEKKKDIVAPMLNSLGSYSNYWCGMTNDYWYMRTDDYIPILERKKKGCFPVPMVHSCVLLNLNVVASDLLTFDPIGLQSYDGPIDDIITFSISAKKAGIEMNVCNEEIYGFIPPPLNENEAITKDYNQILSIKLDIIIEYVSPHVSDVLKAYVPSLPKKDKLGFQQVYLVNLARRTDRREKMLYAFDELGINVKYFEAVDGKKLNDSYLRDMGIKQLQGYKDPWSKRDMTYGEIGCFLSHYFIWQDVVTHNYEQVLLFEDDIRFEPFFREKVLYMMKQVNQLKLEWDLIYFGRKKLKNSEEPWVNGSDMLAVVDYSYWTLCYALSLEGAKKLLNGQPLSKLVPVDEYLPIMFDRHPECFPISGFTFQE